MNNTLASNLRYILFASILPFCSSVTAQTGAQISSSSSPAVGVVADRTAPLSPKPAAALTNGPAGPVVLTFEQLAGYPLRLTDELILSTNRAAWADSQINAFIPENIRKLDGQRVFVEGFMLPVAYEKEALSEFMLVRDMPGCCYGYPPNPHEWVQGVVRNPKVKAEVEHPVRVGGIFHVGAERHGGYLSSIYRLDADSIGDPPKK